MNENTMSEAACLSGPMPPRAHAALAFLRFIGDCRMSRMRYGEERETEELSAVERRTYDSACKLLNQWFLGETILESPPTPTNIAKKDDPPGSVLLPSVK